MHIEIEDLKKLISWNKTETHRPNITLIDLLEQQLAKTPTAIAVTYNQQSLTYLELHKKSNQ
jgi:non-ribosomal peptide synthetase component F